MRTQLQQIADDLAAELGITGAQIALARGEEFAEAATGLANARLGTKMTTGTLIQIGSTTKVHTAALVMQLAGEGLLDIDRPVADHLPELRLGDEESTRTVTPRHLMAMTSGIDNGPYADTGRGDDCVAAYAELLADLPMTFRPGTAYGYSNASTNLSGLLVERLTGLCWDDALRERLLKPAGLANSVSLPEELPFHRVAVGHQPDTREVVPRWTFSRGAGPAGSTLASTAGDLVRFGRLFLRRGVAEDGTRVLPEAAVAEMQTPQVDVPARWFADSWCVGPYLKRWDGVDVFGHSGTNLAGSSTLLWVPERDVAVAVVVNTPARGYPFADAVFDALFPAHFGITKPRRPQPDPHVKIDPRRYTGRFEAHGIDYTVTADSGNLTVGYRAEGEEPLTTALLPLGGDRFLPADNAITGHHNWDIAFTCPNGRAQLLHNGAFTARRTT